MIFEKMISAGKIYALLSLYPGKSAKEVRTLVLTDLKKRMVKTIPLILLIPLLFSLSDIVNKHEIKTIEREDVNGLPIDLPLVLTNSAGEHEILLRVNPVVMSDEEIDKMQALVEVALDPLVLDENPAFDRVAYDLCFPDTLEGFPVLLSWSTSDPSVVGVTGKISGTVSAEPARACICARVNYGDEFRLYEREISVAPLKTETAEQMTESQVRELCAYEQEGRKEKEFIIPEEICGAKVKTAAETKVSAIGPGILLGISVAIGSWTGFFGKLNDRKKKRLTEAEKDCKEFLSKLSILLAAGLTLRGAWKKITEDMEKSGNRGMLSENMAVTLREFLNGCPENIAYERFGERMEITRYQRIAAILSQSITKGVSELPELLSAEIREAVADEREKIKMRGEQASTKLLVPIMGFLIIVFAILLVPAFISF